MAVSALPPRTARQAWAAPGGSHDRLITILRFVLPIAVGVLAAFLVMMPLATGGEVSFLLDKNKVEVAKERLRLQSALYRGTDGKGQPFTLTAGSAVQKSSAEPIVRIDQLAARLQLSDGPARIVAPQGRYDMDNQRVTLVGPVNVVAADGYRLDTTNSTIDLKTRQMRSGGAVTGTVPQGAFSAKQLSADLENHIVRLDGNARLRIVPRKTK
ncbi:LPS export ABC transporter periplasmic protein LptC [Sphingomonas sp. H39-1-10]|uniref:LPS export ABC transporter periplasmic protein LptC n=1 Tax=Sphingomonas TaxID=13687 RepID=UPI00088E75A8|nr:MULTISPECIES: LPS export ABC transporter periplasmic protein LptC [Sphingomonas]MDF0487083.1 LPS export ABC transporter periplasmic protein LptC [Sphingomonas pollutisoli]SDA26474.1 lipopolysaccharide export system protein LptC [Sphingomonas sp. NFR15]